MEPESPVGISSLKSDADEKLARRLHVITKPKVNRRQTSLFDPESSRKLRIWEHRGFYSQDHCDKPVSTAEDESSIFALTHKDSGLSKSSKSKVSTPPIKCTYRTEPVQRFEEEKVRKILKEELEILQEEKYDAGRCRLISKILSERIKQKVKQLEYGRYRYICLVTIGEILGQDLRVASRCMWDSERDNSASESVQNGSLFIEATVFALYKD